MSKDLSLTKQTSPVWFGLSVFVALTIFYTSQYLPIFFLVVILAVTGQTQQQISDLFTDNHAVQVLALVLVALTSIVMIYRYLKWSRVNPFSFLMLGKKPPTFAQLGDVVVTYGLYFMTIFLATVILSFVSTIDPNQVQDLGITRPDTLSALALVFISLVVLPPIGEEILFRGFLFNKLKKYGSKIIAAISVSLLFGLAHLEYGNLNWIAVVDTLIFSFFLIYISQKHKSLYSAMILHAIKNSIAFYVLFVR